MPVWIRFSLRPSIVSIGLLGFAVFLWVTSLGSINVRQMDDTGLVSVLPPILLLAFLLQTAGFALAVSRRPPPIPLLFVHLVLLIVTTYGITSIVYDTPRFAIGWKLAGVMDYIMKTGTVDARIDAFFNWPGFFILMAFLTKTAGLDSPQILMMWAPVFFNLLYLGPLWMLFRSATADLRLAVLAIWFFYLANWIGQDYLAPQALNFFFFLVCLAILLTWLRGTAGQEKDVPPEVRNRHFQGTTRRDKLWSRLTNRLSSYEHPAAPSTPAQRVALLCIILLILMAMVSSHQLTPFFTLSAIIALVLFDRCTVRTLPLILGVMLVTWIFYMATPYVQGHIEQIISPVGAVTVNLDENLTQRFRGSPAHVFINYMRAAMSAGVWALALFGVMRRLRNGYRDSTHMLLALTPFPLLLLQAYGGELLLRSYLFAAPFMAFFGAGLFFPSPLAGRGWQSTVALWIVSFVMLVGFLFTRYGNDRMMYFTDQEVAAIEHLYEIAEPGSQLVAATGTLPWRYQGYRTYRYTMVPSLVRTGDLAALGGLMADRQYPVSYLILTRSQQASGELYIGWPPGTWKQFQQALHDSDEFTRIYANDDAEIYGLSADCHELAYGAYACSAHTLDGQ